MDPSYLEQRVGRVEQNVATVVERVDGLRREVTLAASAPQAVALLAQKVEDVIEDVDAMSTQIGAVKQMLEKRDQQASSERNSVKIALISLTGTIVVTVLSAILTFVLA